MFVVVGLLPRRSCGGTGMCPPTFFAGFEPVTSGCKVTWSTRWAEAPRDNEVTVSVSEISKRSHIINRKAIWCAMRSSMVVQYCLHDVFAVVCWLYGVLVVCVCMLWYALLLYVFV